MIYAGGVELTARASLHDPYLDRIHRVKHSKVGHGDHLAYLHGFPFEWGRSA